MDLLLLQQIINDQQRIVLKKEHGILRDLDYSKYRETQQITDIAGIHQSVKSTLLLNQ